MMKPKFAIQRRPLHEYGQIRYQTMAVTLILTFIIFTGLFAYASLEKIKQEIATDNQKYINTTLKTTHSALNVWVDELHDYVKQFADDPALTRLVTQQLSLKRDPQTLQNSTYLAELRTLYDRKELLSRMGFFVIAPDHISIASRRDSNIGTKNFIAQTHPELLKKIFSGHSALIAPLFSDVPLTQPGNTNRPHELTMFMATPIYDEKRNIIAALTIRIDPQQSFTKITSLAGNAYKGLTYAFGREGVPFSATPSADSPPTPYIRNALAGIIDESPVALEQAASYAITAPKKYINHNGKTVLGAFLWDKRLGIGLTSEIDYDAAMQHYYQPRNTILGLFSTTVVMALTIILVITLLVRNSNRHLQRLNDELEKSVTDRTRQLTQTNSSLLKAKNELDAILTSIPDAIIGVDETGRVVSANPQSSALLGYDNDELVGLEVERLIPAHHQLKHATKRREMMAKKITSLKPSRPLVALSKDGTEIPIEISVNSFEVEGKWLAVTSLRDIGERLRIEEEKKQLQAQLIQATKMETVGQLTGGIAHDFNNILTSIMGFTELSQHVVKGKNSQLETYLNAIYQSSERASELVKQMLAFSRSDGGGQYPVEPHPIVNEVADMLRSTSPSSMNINLKTSKHNLSITIDPAQLHLAIMNLVMNSKHALAGKGNINIEVSNKHISARPCSSCHKTIDGEYVAIEICDDGPGIEQEHISRIFDPFFTTKQVGQGSGMGLSMVHGIVHGGGGHVLVDSSPGCGACITLLFPESQLPANTNGRETHDAQETSAPTGKGHIMIVDDEQTITAFMKDIVESWGYQVTTFNHPEDALKALQDASRSFNLIISDQTMPDMLGTELAIVCQKLRPELPFVLYSGYSEDVDEHNYKRLGIAAYFSKPVDSRTLREKLAELTATKDYPL